MPLDKHRRLAELKDEVAELHPLLRRMLPKLPRVIQVEYTHGPTEMGADFIVHRSHDVLGDTQYIGIVAKVGKIHQDYADVERQIEECWVPRTVSGGKQRVRMNEVWVIVTEHITKGAQDKIHSKYATAKLEFISGQRLAALIDTYLPDFWTDIDLDIGEYLAALRERNSNTDRALSLIRVNDADFYIQQDVIRLPDEEYTKQARGPSKATPIDILDEISKRKSLVIEGAMGAGKSKLLRHLAGHYAAPSTFLATKLLPLPISYKEFADDFSSNIDNVLASRVPKEVHEALPDGAKFLLLIDGVDEKDQTLEQQVEAIRRLVTDVNSRTNVKVVITSRYLTRLNAPKSLALGARRYGLKPLSLARVMQFLTTLCSRLSAKSRILEDLKKSPLFRELPKSPIAAILLAQLLNQNSDELPSNMTELYAKYLELMLGRWDIEKGLQSQKEYEALDNILMSLAVHLLQNELLLVSEAELKGMFVSYLKERNLEIDSDALFERTLRRSDVLVQDPVTKTISFKHRTFAEFFYARSLSRNGVPPIDNRVFQPYWLNVYFFLLGIQKDTPVVLGSIIDLQPQSEGERILKFINLGNYCLAAYSTPYAIVTRGLQTAIQDAAAFYLDVANGKSTSFFVQLPRMTSLWLLQRIVRDVYAYSFFRQAIEEAALTLDDGELPDELKAYALFLLNVTSIDIGTAETFDFLLQRYSTQLPFDLALAVRHEAEGLKGTSDLMKRHDRRITKLLRTDKKLREQVDTLYQPPARQARLSIPTSGSAPTKR